MKVIAHRGNLKGPNPERENSPEYLLEAIEAGYDCEVDVWYDNNNQLYLGHDHPHYKIDHAFLSNKHFWCHAKNLEALEYMLVNNIHCFWHEHDARTLTSKGFIWTYPKQETTFKSIICMITPEDIAPKDCYGICTDWVNNHR